MISIELVVKRGFETGQTIFWCPPPDHFRGVLEAVFLILRILVVYVFLLSGLRTRLENRSKGGTGPAAEAGVD